MDRTFILNTTAASGEYSGFEYRTFAVIDMTPELARLILARIALFNAAKAQDSSLLELYFWDRHPVFARAGDTLSETDVDTIEDNDSYLVVAQNPFPLDALENTECDQMVVSDDDVRWTVIPKHSETYAITAGLPVSEIARFA